MYYHGRNTLLVSKVYFALWWIVKYVAWEVEKIVICILQVQHTFAQIALEAMAKIMENGNKITSMKVLMLVNRGGKSFKAFSMRKVVVQSLQAWHFRREGYLFECHLFFFSPTILCILSTNLFHILRCILVYTMSQTGNIVNTFVAFRGIIERNTTDWWKIAITAENKYRSLLLISRMTDKMLLHLVTDYSCFKVHLMCKLPTHLFLGTICLVRTLFTIIFVSRVLTDK